MSNCDAELKFVIDAINYKICTWKDYNQMIYNCKWLLSQILLNIFINNLLWSIKPLSKSENPGIDDLSNDKFDLYNKL